MAARVKRAARSGAKVVRRAGGAPVAFGWKTAWLAVPNAKPRDVAKALDVGAFEPCRWDAGIAGAVRSAAIFISPPIDGYTLVVDAWLGDRRTEHVAAMSRRFGEANLFVSQRVTDDYAGLAAKRGKLVRRVKPRDEENVFALAGKWSVDPRTLHDRAATPLGLAAPSPNASIASALFPETVLLQKPARSATEAVLHAHTTFRACPGCRESHIARYPAFAGLPWEKFAIAIPIVCANGPCQRHWLVAYPAASGYETAPADDKPIVTASRARSRLLGRAQWLALVEQAEANMLEIRDWNYPAEELVRESRRFAREAIACLLEAVKHGEPANVKRLARLLQIASDGS